MKKGKNSVDSTRASRDGHEFHEAWTARKAMQLLQPDNDLAAIAVEGLSPTDQAKASAETIQIADITLYYGSRPTFNHASRTSIVQFKYSVSNKNEDFRAHHAKKTIQKFANTYRDHKKKYGAQAVQTKLDFQLITNQPIYEPLLQTIEAITSGSPVTGDVKKQAEQYKAATGFDGKMLATFAAKCRLIGGSGSLPAAKSELESRLVDWSATNDSMAKARLGELSNMVREKAGYAGTNQNLITRTDILAALQIGDSADLLPCKPALVDVGKVLEREQLADAIAHIQTNSAPLLIHAAGGVGKTVFMDSLAEKIHGKHEVVFFDCFGGGAYRSPEDARHLPQNGLIHIANTLAFGGLCDPILPGNPDTHTLLKTFRRRLGQCINTISRATPERELVLFIDAIDNADIAASHRGDDAFPVKLMESLHSEPIPGVKFVVSCRTERKPSTYAKYEDFELRPFSKDETASFLRARSKVISQVEVNVAQARSGGNPRILDYLLMSGKGLLDESEIDKKIELNELIEKKITDSLATAMERGSAKKDINTFLAGLAVLPPPVPLDECAEAHGIELSAIESFASDLTPLLELTNQGLMFRDEPTETLVRNQYASSKGALHRVARNLLKRQDVSVYAARALPDLLHALDDGKTLFDLAFDERIPRSITSSVGRRNIRYARLCAATLHAALSQDYNRLVRLLVEFSTITASDQRGIDYILDYPDLVIAANDVDSLRRLFETRTGWPGTRHARLAIAYTLSGEFEEASRHIVTTNEWVNHHYRRDYDRQMHRLGPERRDIAAIPFYLISQDLLDNAVRFLKVWRDWYAYEVCEYVFDYSRLAETIQAQPQSKLNNFIDMLKDIGPITAALSLEELPKPKRKDLIKKLARLSKQTAGRHLSKSYPRDHHYPLQEGLRKAAAVAMSLGLDAEALAISLRAPHARPGIWYFRDGFRHNDVFSFVFRTALVAAAKRTTLHEKDVLPKELAIICSRVSRNLTGQGFRDKAKQRISKYVQKARDEGKAVKRTPTLSYEEKQETERFLAHRLEPLHSLTKAFSTALASSSRNVNKAFGELLNAWEDACQNHDSYRSGKIKYLFCFLGLDMSLSILWARSELNPASIKRFLTIVHTLEIGTYHLTRIVSILAKRQPWQKQSGEQSLKTRTLIEAENDVVERAFQLGALGRAMLPANIDDASAYFREGLEQMDAIGSGDNQFTEELLSFASKMKGEELDENEFHTLTNICELNMSDEPENFSWGMFGSSFSKVAGPKGLAKLSRWDDRDRISLRHTFLPYLTALVQDGKLGPKDALALNHLAKPAEYHSAGTKEFAKVVREKAGPDPDTINELIQQFQDNNPYSTMDSTIATLASLAEETLGPSSEIFRYLSAARKSYKKVSGANHETWSHDQGLDPRMRKRVEDIDRKNRAALDCIAAATDPKNEVSLLKAINDFSGLQNTYELKSGFFDSLRTNVPFGYRSQYIRTIRTVENFNFSWKLDELKECKQSWAGSFAALDQVCREQAIPLIRLHADDLVNGERLLGYKINEMSDITGVPVAELVLELIKVFACRDSSVSGAVWLALASFICPQADAGHGQLALERLLGSDAAKLADNVVDGTWKDGLYPKDDVPTIAAGFVWRMLGAPAAESRWRAAHSIRCFARLGRWEIVDSLVENINSKTAGAFQASELKFYYLHARLWLLIALARIAKDYPEEIARYKDKLLAIATEKNDPHVLMRHFAARALLSCINAGKLDLPARTADCLQNADLSPHPRSNKRVRAHRDFYQGRPSSAPKPKFEFHLDYDFQKDEVDGLGRIFGISCWEVTDMMSAIVEQLDSGVSNMYEPGGRESRTNYNMSTRYHMYGQQLGWHALFFAAGKILPTFPVTDDWWYEDDPWGEWLGRYVLTRDDGLWLSDGTDRTPLDSVETLLEKKKKGVVLTGDPKKLLRLAGLTSRVGKELVIQGAWFSADDIRVNISSTLVPPKTAAMFARKLTREQPILVWIPVFHQRYGILEQPTEKKGHAPWIVCVEGEPQLDEHDPYGAPCANLRPYIAPDYTAFWNLFSDDSFRRTWLDKRGKQMLRVQAWGREDKFSEEGPHSGLRLFCNTSVLKKILNKYEKELLILIKLQRHEKEYRGQGKWTHSVAVARISKTLELEFFKGRSNYLYKPRY
ncbi:MAG: ATP-binding protein [Nitrospinae bacterium]|nr:ATP-binding protein [Nitrospinota bacterium]